MSSVEWSSFLQSTINAVYISSRRMINVSYSKDQKSNFSYILVSRCFQGAACANAVIILVLPQREPFSHSVPAALGLTGLLYGRSFTGSFPNIIFISTKKTLSPNPLPSSLSEHLPYYSLHPLSQYHHHETSNPAPLRPPRTTTSSASLFTRGETWGCGRATT